MLRLKYALRFINLSFQAAQKDEVIQKPWMYLTLGSLALSFFWLLPIAIMILWIGPRPVVWIVIGFIFLVYLLSLLAWGELSALPTAQIFSKIIEEGQSDFDQEQAGDIFSRYWLDVLLYILSLPSLRLTLGFQDLFYISSKEPGAWKKALPLLPPIIVLEDLKLRDAIQRVKTIVQGNYLRFQPGYIRVGLVSIFVEWVLIIAGSAIGVFLAAAIADPLTSGPWRLLFAVVTGMLIFGIFSTLGIAFSTYFRTCYQTALYLWALWIEAARQEGVDGQVSPPEILRQAMLLEPLYDKDG